MTLGELAGVASAIGTLVALGTTIWNVLASGSRQNKGRLDAHEAKLVSIDGRVASLEQWVKSLPSTTERISGSGQP